MPNFEINQEPRYLERRFEAIEAAIGATLPAMSGAVTPAPLHPTLTNKTIAATQTTVAHGLSYTPKLYAIIMTSAGTVWRSAASDGTNIYLTADSAGRTCDIVVGY